MNRENIIYFGLAGENIENKSLLSIRPYDGGYFIPKALKPKYAQNNFKYNGKELQNQEFSDGTGIEDYDYGARMYDPQNGRHNQIDVHANKYYFESPFSYGANNPLSYIDPDEFSR